MSGEDVNIAVVTVAREGMVVGEDHVVVQVVVQAAAQAVVQVALTLLEADHVDGEDQRAQKVAVPTLTEIDGEDQRAREMIHIDEENQKAHQAVRAVVHRHHGKMPENIQKDINATRSMVEWSQQQLTHQEVIEKNQQQLMMAGQYLTDVIDPQIKIVIRQIHQPLRLTLKVTP